MSETNTTEQFHDYDTDELLPREYHFKYRGKSYILREPPEEASIKLRTTQFRNARMVDGKISASLEDAAKSQVLLLSYCVYTENHPDPKLNNQLVSEKELKGWGTSIVKDLFEKAKEMGDMNEGETKESLEKQREEIEKKLEALANGDTAEARAKNELGNMTGTSS